MLKSCHEVHRLVAESYDRPLPWFTRFRVRLHLLACDACTNFKRNMTVLRRAMQKMDS